jgi:hypothetical protein
MLYFDARRRQPVYPFGGRAPRSDDIDATRCCNALVTMGHVTSVESEICIRLTPRISSTLSKRDCHITCRQIWGVKK